jgi:hypothetical protein
LAGGNHERRATIPELPEVVVPEAAFDWYQPHEATRMIQSARAPWKRAVSLLLSAPDGLTLRRASMVTLWGNEERA